MTEEAVTGERVVLTVNGVPVRVRWPLEEPADDIPADRVCNCRFAWCRD